MPIYTYKCTMCGQAKDEIFKLSERPDCIPCSCATDGQHPTSMMLTPSLSSFVITGYRASNGYSISEDIQNRK